MINVGMDVHVRNSYLSVRTETGRRLKRGRIGNTMAEIAEFLGPFEDQAMRVALENTTNARAIHGLLLAYSQEAGIDLTAEVLVTLATCNATTDRGPSSREPRTSRLRPLCDRR